MRLYLTKTDPARNMARFYSLDIQPTPFGEWALVREWGRIGGAGPLVRSGRPPWRWPSTSKPSSAKAMRPFEFCALGLSELALFGPTFEASNETHAARGAMAADLKAGQAVDAEYITGGLIEFEGLAL